MIKEQPHDIIVHVGTKDLTNNVKLLNKKGNSAFAKNLLHHIHRTEWSFFPYGLVTVNDCLSSTLKKAKSGRNSSLENIRTISILIFVHLNINSIRNKFYSLADIIKDKIDILMISETTHAWKILLSKHLRMNLLNLTKEPTCFKNPENPACIDK